MRLMKIIKYVQGLLKKYIKLEKIDEILKKIGICMFYRPYKDHNRERSEDEEGISYVGMIRRIEILFAYIQKDFPDYGSRPIEYRLDEPSLAKHVYVRDFPNCNKG